MRMEDGQIGVEVAVPLDADELRQFEMMAMDVGATVDGLAKSIALSVIGRGVDQRPDATAPAVA